MSELMRRGLILAVEEATKADAELFASGEGSERQARQALRLLAACDPDSCEDATVQAAHVGGLYDVLRGLRKALNGSETNVLAAQLLGLHWLFADPKAAAHPWPVQGDAATP